VTLYDLDMHNYAPGLPIDWPSHAVTLYQSASGYTIFDPSYGLAFSAPTLSAARLAWEQSSVQGFCRMLWSAQDGFLRDYYPYDYVRNTLKKTGDLIAW
jgi:hypothetical protein